MRTGTPIVWLVACLAASCSAGAPAPQRPVPPPIDEPPPHVEQPQGSGQGSAQESAAVVPDHPAAPPDTMYALDEALADALSGPLTQIGAGGWFGLFRIAACAYHNDRVIVVNLYCTAREMSSFGLVVLSPTRGRAYFYAEAKRPISTIKRADYFTFTGETSPALTDAQLPPLSLAFSYKELRAWDEIRYYRNVPGCSAGVELGKPDSGCQSPRESDETAWVARNKPFLDAPPADWYRIVKELRARAPTDAKQAPP